LRRGLSADELGVPLVTVLLPVLDAADTLARAAECITNQTLEDLELLIILNGSSAPTRDLAATLAARDSRVRTLHLANPNLAAALNTGLHAAASGLIARMDADDECPPHRLRAQVDLLAEHPTAAAAACDWEVRDPSGRLMATNRPPRTADEGCWRLLLGNPYAHGSMMMRAGRVLEGGGYDTRLARAQDLDLWLRLREHGGAVTAPQTLYTHHLRTTETYASSRGQADAAAAILLKAWATLPQGDRSELAPLLADVMFAAGGGQSSIRAIEDHLTARGPSREGLLAYLWAQRHLPPTSRRAAEISRRTHARRVLSLLGDGPLWLYGAGSHTSWLFDAVPELRSRVLGIVDDHAQWQSVAGFIVGAPESIPSGSRVLLSSDSAEDALWERAQSLIARGVSVHRLYADDSGC
jgi:hypothetical protein